MAETESGNGGDGAKDPYLELEYKECQNWERFIAGVRFTFFASFILFFGILIGAYYKVWMTPEKHFIETSKWFVLYTISTFGLIVGIGALIIEARNIALIRTFSNHSMDLEDEMGPTRNNRVRLRERTTLPETRKPIRVLFGAETRHSTAIRMLYFVIEVIWIALIFYSIYLAYK